MRNKILIPFDFSPVSEKALALAIETSKLIDVELVLLHMVAKDDLIEDAQLRLNSVAEANSLKAQITTLVNVGEIFDGIEEAAEQAKAQLIVMGTHGLRGLQYIFGSRALKVVTSSTRPFIIVQEDSEITGIDEIVVPVRITQQEKQILQWVATLAKVFKAKVFLFAANSTDEFLRNKIHRNVSFAKEYLKNKEVEFDVATAEDEDDFDEQIVEYAQSVRADLIAIINHDEVGFKNIYGANYDQNIITNDANIPVLILNPKNAAAYIDIFSQFFNN